MGKIGDANRQKGRTDNTKDYQVGKRPAAESATSQGPATLGYARLRPPFFLPVIPLRPSPIFLANAERTFA